MSVFKSRPALRWLVPSAAAVVVIGGGAAAGTIVASAEPSLPERSAAQLLVDVQNARVDGLSGTIVQSADLGLPDLGGLGEGGAALTKLVTGSNTVRVWYAGEDKVRLAVLGNLGQTDVVRNGSDAWLWRSDQKAATHFKLPAGEKRPAELASPVPATPQDAAEAALAAIDPSTEVSTTGAAEVAGRDAYELVLAPRTADTLIGQVRLAIDAETHIPLRVDVYAKNVNNPAFRVAFQQISYDTPDDQQFVFNPPPGTKVEEANASQIEKEHAKAVEKAAEKAAEKAPKPAAEPKTIGEGWATVVTAKMPTAKGAASPQLDTVLGLLTKTSGSWGSGRILAGSLFSVLVTDDGRVFAGAVPPETLYRAAAK